jgi:hypothetical protein
VKFPAQKEHAQQTETGAKTKVNNWDWDGAEGGACVVELKSSTGAIIK